MVWMIDGIEVDSFGPRSVPSDSFPQEPVNIILQNVTVGDIESETSFTSFMWFNISTYKNSSVTCKSDDYHTVTIHLGSKLFHYIYSGTHISRFYFADHEKAYVHDVFCL